MIKARSRAVGLTCIVCTAITVAVLVVKDGATAYDVLRLLGLYPVRVIDVFKCILLVCILYLGPFFEDGIVEGNWTSYYSLRELKAAVWDDWQGLRNIVIGPASEELVFRSLVIPLFLLAQVSACFSCCSEYTSLLTPDDRPLPYT